MFMCLFLAKQQYLLERKLGVACGTDKAVDTPGLIQCRRNLKTMKTATAISSLTPYIHDIMQILHENLYF